MKNIIGQFSRFFMAGAISALIQFSVLIVLVEFFLANPLLASTLGFLVGAFINYVLNHYFTFKSVSPHRQALLRFTLNSIFGVSTNFLIMYFLLKFYSYLFSQVFTSIIILVWNFFIHRAWTFRA